MKPPDLFRSNRVVAVEKYKGKGIAVTEKTNGSDLPCYFYFVCDRLFKEVLSDNSHDCGEGNISEAIARAKNTIDNFL